MILSFLTSTPCVQTLRYVAGGVGCLLAVATPSLGQDLSQPAPSVLEAAISSRAYIPPAGSRGSGGATTGGGVRGCGGEMIALAPAFNGTGQTFSTRPTFVWYLGDVPTERLRFTLFHQGPAGETEVFSQDLTAATSGYQALTLPAAAPPLEIGETYRWETTLFCEADSDEVRRWVEAPIEIVDPPRSLALLDTVAPTPWQKGVRFAQAGYWYDALAQVYVGDTAGAQALRQDLLLDLADLAAEADTNAATRWSDRLRALVVTP